MRIWLEKRELEERDYEIMHVPERYRTAEWDKVSCDDPEIRTVLDRYRGNLRSASMRGMGMYIWGPLGSGKTAVASLLLSGFRAHGQSALFSRADMLLKSAFKTIRVSEDQPDLWSYARKVQVLLIDDFGKSFQDAKGYSDFEFEGLLRERYDAKLVTLMTSNISPSSLVDDFKTKDSTISILQASMIALRVEGFDHRANETRGENDFFIG